MIWNAIMKLTWFIFVQGPLNLIAAFTKVLEYLTGGIINDILFGSSKEFKWNNIPSQFWWFVIIAICLFSLVFTIQMIVIIFKEATETKTKFVAAIQNAIKAFGFMFLIPIFFFLANFIIQNLANTIINNFGNNSNIAQYLWHIGDPNWDGTANDVPGSYGYPSNVGDYNMIAQIFGTWFMLFAIFMIGIILVQKIIELFFLFIISPIVMIVMVIDDGKAAFQWKDMVGAKFLASTATLIGYYIFISVTQILLSSDLQGLNASDFSKSLFIILFLCGGGLATLAFSDMVAHFVGEGAGIKEGMSSLRATMAGGMMAMGAARVAGKALGFMRNKRSKVNKQQNYANSSLMNENINSNNDDQELSFSSFRNASKGLASRTGILGLAGLGLGAAAIGLATFRGAKKAGGLKAGIKAFSKGFGKAIVSPFVKTGKALNPELWNFGKAKVKKISKNVNKKEIVKITKKIDKTKEWMNKFQDDVNVYETGYKKISKANKKLQKLEKREEKYKISDSSKTN